MIDLKQPLHAPRWLGPVLGIVALLGAFLILELRVFRPMQVERDQLQRTYQSQLAHAASQPLTVIVTETSPLQRLDDLSKTLRGLDGPHTRIEGWHAVAEQNTVRIKSVNYQQTTEGSELRKTVLQANLEGTYPALRYFIRAALAADPGCALESLQFSQTSNGSGVLKAQLQFALYSTANAAASGSD